MNPQQQTRHKYLINCQEGASNVERATISLILATSASKDNEAVMFLTSDAAPLCVKGGVDGLSADGMEPMTTLIEQFIGNGGRMWLCPICAKVHGISESDLIEGAEIAGAPKTMAYLEAGGKVLA